MRTALIAPTALLLLAAACTPGQPGQAPLSEAAPPASAELDEAPVAPPAIEGAYRLAGVNGKDVDMPWGMAVEIDGDTIVLTSQCIRAEWTYQWQGDTLVTRSVPAPTCRRGHHEAEAGAIAVFGAGGKARWTPQNGLLITGSGGSLTLFSQ